MKNQLKVLINALHAKSGGGVTYLQNILPFFATEKSIETHLCIHESQSDILNFVPEGVVVHILKFRSGFFSLPFYEQILVPRLARHLSISVTFSPANYGPFFSPRHIILLRNTLSVGFLEKRCSKIIYWVLVFFATFFSMIFSKKIIAVSSFVLNSNGKILSLLFRSKSLVIHHGVSNIYKPPKKEQMRDDFILVVSDLYVQKNIETLLLALDRVRKKYPNVLLKIAGRNIDQGYFEQLQRIIMERAMENNVLFLGYVNHSELSILYKQCRFFIFPSLVESFGNPLLEAMASGAPIASSNTAAMPEVIGNAALYFNPRNTTEIADILDKLLKDEKLRNSLSKKSVERAKLFSWSKTAKETLDVIKSAAVR